MRISCLLISLLALSSCKSESEKLLVGKWNAAYLVECDDIVPINTSIVNLEFQSDGKYVFNSTLNVHEEGKYRLSGVYLYTQDKIKTNAPEKAVRIKTVSEDTLILEMKFKGKEQLLTLFKESLVTGKKNNAIAANVPKDSAKRNTPPSTQPIDSQSVVAVIPLIAAVPPATPKPEEKKEVKPEPKKPELTAREAYLKREELRKKEEEEQKAQEKRRREAYLKRDAEQKAEDKRKHDAYLKREAERKKAAKSKK